MVQHGRVHAQCAADLRRCGAEHCGGAGIPQLRFLGSEEHSYRRAHKRAVPYRVLQHHESPQLCIAGQHSCRTQLRDAFPDARRCSEQRGPWLRRPTPDSVRAEAELLGSEMHLQRVKSMLPVLRGKPWVLLLMLLPVCAEMSASPQVKQIGPGLYAYISDND